MAPTCTSLPQWEMTSVQWTFQTMQHNSVLRTATLDDQCNAMLLLSLLPTINTTLGLPPSNCASLFTTNSSNSTEIISIKTRPKKTRCSDSKPRPSANSNVSKFPRYFQKVNPGWVTFTREEPVSTFLFIYFGPLFQGTLLHSKIFKFF